MKLSVKLFFAWLDFWIGFYWDRDKRTLYIAPLPCFVFKFEFRRKISFDICACGHSRDLHEEVGCIARNKTGSWHAYCPCYRSIKSFPPACPPRQDRRPGASCLK